MEKKVEKIIETMNPDERAIIPYLGEGNMEQIAEKSGFDKTKTLRTLQFLSNKKILEIETTERKLIDLGDNGVNYLKSGLPERKLLILLAEEKTLGLEEANKKSRLSDNEFKAAIGVLKKKAMIDLQNGKIILKAGMEEVVKKSLEEVFLEALPLELASLKPEQKLAFENLKTRKDIVRLEDKKQIDIKLTELGKEIIKADLSKYKDLIETLTPEILAGELWKGKKFRRYDITSPIPKISGGKRHFVNQAIDYARKIWTELGFKEMSGSKIQTGFWNFDALFTAQDHPVREIQDTFYIKDTKGKLSDKKIVAEVKKSHEQGVGGSRGWQYNWNEEEAKKVILRTHTTCLSAQTLASLRNLKTEDKKGKFFAIGKCFRNETVDWGHLFEFNQTEGIVVDRNANFRHLLGYLESFFKKMGFEKVKFYPSYFPYTEPSTEIYGYHSGKKVWMEIGGAGMFRPEVVIPMIGEDIPVLAWGPGFDRSIMEYYQVKDLRELYKNDITKLREMKFWVK